VGTSGDFNVKHKESKVGGKSTSSGSGYQLDVRAESVCDALPAERGMIPE